MLLSLSLAVFRRLLLVLALSLVAEVSLNEVVDVAVEHVLYLGSLHAGPDIFGQSIGLEDVVPNLISHGNFAFFVVELLHLGPAFLLFDPIQLGFKQGESHLVVFVLTALAAAFGGDAGRQMRIPD